MLMQNFLPAATLGLTEPQHRALVLTLNALERGELVHISYDKMDEYTGKSSRPSFNGFFNMGEWAENHTCGTVGCIGGTAEMLGGLEYNELESVCWRIRCNGDDGLHLLFFPRLSVRIVARLTVDQAAIALRAYLTTGKPDWSYVNTGTSNLEEGST